MPFLTDEDKEGGLGHYLDARFGMTMAIDGIGNVVGTWFGVETNQMLPPVMTGSHIDTVRTGGRFDGNLGVLAGLEVIETLSHRVSPVHPIAVVFTGEEDRFAPTLGSPYTSAEWVLKQHLTLSELMELDWAQN